MHVRDEITRYAAALDQPVLLWLLQRYHRESQWRFVARCTFRRQGHESWNCIRIWAPTREGRVLYAALSPDSNIAAMGAPLVAATA